MPEKNNNTPNPGSSHPRHQPRNSGSRHHTNTPSRPRTIPHSDSSENLEHQTEDGQHPSDSTTPHHSRAKHPATHFDNARGAAKEIKEKRRSEDTKKTQIPPLAPGDIRIIILGGVEEIGRNMSAIEFGNDIVIVDCGMQFKEESTPGIECILANTEYLEARKDKIRAIAITHGHLDHIGGIPYLIERLGNPPIYTRNLTGLIIKKRQDEFPHLDPLDLRIVESESRVRFQDLGLRFFSVTHTIPDSMGIIVDTPFGGVVFTGDLKLDHVGGIPTPAEEKEFGRFANENILMLLADSTNCERPGFSIPETVVHKTLEEIIRTTRGRLIIGTFASLLERIIKIVEISERLGKKVVIEGRSMKTNVEIARVSGLLDFKPGTVIPIEEMGNYAPDRIVMLVTGAQGDEFAVMMRAAHKKHKHVKITNTDTILFSSSVVPGNERAVQKLKDLLSRQGAKIVHYATSDVHSSGHAYRDETMWIHSKVNPRFFVPLHGYHYMLRVHTEIAEAIGVPKDNITIPDNGSLIEIREKGTKMVVLPQTAPNNLILVDGFSIGGIQEVVIRDRQALAQDGMFVIIATVDVNTGKVVKSPDIISRGFVYLRESQELLQQSRLITKKTIEDTCGGMKPINFEFVKEYIRDNVGKYLFQKTRKQPMVIPVLLGV